MADLENRVRRLERLVAYLLYKDPVCSQEELAVALDVAEERIEELDIFEFRRRLEAGKDEHSKG